MEKYKNFCLYHLMYVNRSEVQHVVCNQFITKSWLFSVSLFLESLSSLELRLFHRIHSANPLWADVLF